MPSCCDLVKGYFDSNLGLLNQLIPFLSSWEGSLSVAGDVENQEPGEEQAVKHVRLEYEAQVVQCVLPLLTYTGYVVYLCMGYSHHGSCVWFSGHRGSPQLLMICGIFHWMSIFHLALAAFFA